MIPRPGLPRGAIPRPPGEISSCSYNIYIYNVYIYNVCVYTYIYIYIYITIFLSWIPGQVFPEEIWGRVAWWLTPKEISQQSYRIPNNNTKHIAQRISCEKDIPSGGSRAGSISQTSCPTAAPFRSTAASVGVAGRSSSSRTTTSSGDPTQIVTTSVQ